MTCPVCQGKCCRDVDSGYRVEHKATWYEGSLLEPAMRALANATAEARRLSTAVDRLERESLEVIAVLGLHEDTSHDKVLAQVRSLVTEHRAERSVTRAGLDDLLARVEQGARAVERDKIVAWLRDGADIAWEPASLQIADAIESGDHLREWDQK